MAISRHPFFQRRELGSRWEKATCPVKLRESEADLGVDPRARATG